MSACVLCLEYLRIFAYLYVLSTYMFIPGSERNGILILSMSCTYGRIDNKVDFDSENVHMYLKTYCEINHTW